MSPIGWARVVTAGSWLPPESFIIPWKTKAPHTAAAPSPAMLPSSHLAGVSPLTSPRMKITAATYAKG